MALRSLKRVQIPMRIYPAIVEGQQAVTIVWDDDEMLTAEAENLLPKPIRRRIHDLATRVDPAGDLQQIAELKMMVRALEARLAEREP